MALLARFCLFESQALTYPYQLEVRESLSLHQALLVSRGEPLYRVRAEPPLVIPPYGPVFPVVVAPLVRAFGASLTAPRLVSAGSLLGTLLLVFLTVAAVTGRRGWGLVAVGFVLQRMDWWRWLTLARPDSLGCFLITLGLYVHWRWPRESATLRRVLFLGVLAFLTKVPSAVGLLSSLVHMSALRGTAVERVLLIGAGGAVLAAAVGVLAAVTGGLYLVFTVHIMSAWTSVSFPTLGRCVAQLLVYYLPAWLALGHGLLARSARFHRVGVFGTHVLVATPCTMALLLNDGGDAFYWFAVVPALAVVATAQLADLSFETPGLAVATASGIALWMALWSGWTPGRHVVPEFGAMAQCWEELERVVRNAPGPVLNDDATAILNIRAGKTLHAEGVGYERNKEWLERHYGYVFMDLKPRLRARYYSLILNPEDPEALRSEYELAGRCRLPLQFGDRLLWIDVYRPRPLPDARGVPTVPSSFCWGH